jgi:hypothetical protein
MDETFTGIGVGCRIILAEIAVEVVVKVGDVGTSGKPNDNTVAGPLITSADPTVTDVSLAGFEVGEEE